MTVKLQRHIGVIKNLGTRVVVVFNEIPEREDHALVVNVDALPPKYMDSFADIINGEAQKTHELSNLLSTRRFPTGEVMLSALHQNGYLRPEPVNNIDMMVTRHDRMPLTDIVNEMRKMNNKEPLVVENESEVKTEQPELNLTSPVSPPQSDTTTITAADLLRPLPEAALAPETTEDLAKQLMEKSAEMLKVSKELKEQAIKMNPELKSKRGRKKKEASE